MFLRTQRDGVSAARFWIEVGGQFAIGEGGVALLERIAATRSLTTAAQQIGWSYRHAWGYVKTAERQLGLRLVQVAPGKGRQRGSVLTAEGEWLLLSMIRAREELRLAANRTAVSWTGCPTVSWVAPISASVGERSARVKTAKRRARRGKS